MRKSFFSASLVFILIAVLALPQFTVAEEGGIAAGAPDVLSDKRELLVQLRAANRRELATRMKTMRTALAEMFGREYREDGAAIQATYGDAFVRLQIPVGMTEEAFTRQLIATGAVAGVEANKRIFPLMVPDDTYYQYQWNLKLVHAEGAWDHGTGEGVTVAVLDSGIAYETFSSFVKSPDFGGTKFVEGYDFINRDTHANDDYGHGTHIAGILAATSQDRYGIAGAAPGVTLMPVKVLDRRGGGTVADLAQGVRWAADHGAKVINMSVGTAEKSDILTDALSYAYGKGVVLVAAGGNEASSRLLYPAAVHEYVIAVGAADLTGDRTSYSNAGDGLDLIAPGGSAALDQNGDGQPDGILSFTLERYGSYVNTRRFSYVFAQGTSVAAPHVSAAAAMIVAQGVSDPAAVRMILRNSADDKSELGWDRNTGAGLLNMEQALQLARNSGSPAGGIVTGSQSQIVRSGETQPPSPDSQDGDDATTTPADEGSNAPAPQNNAIQEESSSATPSVTSLKTTLRFFNRFGREMKQFTWWDTITVQVQVADQSGAPVPGASVELRFRVKGGSDLGSDHQTSDEKGVSRFVIGPFKRGSTIEAGAVATLGAIHSPLVTGTMFIR